MAYRSNVTEDNGLFKGEDKELDFVIYEEATTESEINNDPTQNRQTIAGWALEWTLAQKAHQTPLISKRSVDLEINITNPSQGECSVTLLAAETLNIAPGTYQHTLWREDSGSKTVLSFGSFAVRDPVEET